MRSNLYDCAEPTESERVLAVWRKGRVVSGYDPNIFREDACGALMLRTLYGKTEDLGWEIDHIVPQIKGGSNDLSNLQPLQWENNRSKGDRWPWAPDKAA